MQRRRIALFASWALLLAPVGMTQVEKERALDTLEDQSRGAQVVTSEMSFTGTTAGPEGQLLFQGEGTYLVDQQVVLFSLPISEITSKEITLEAKDRVFSFVISRETKLCKNKKKATWRSFKMGDLVTVCSRKDEMTAISIRFGPALFQPSTSGVKLQTYDCR
jgi:hypothetical protein